MTTSVTIDAHAGWDVEVTTEDLDSNGVIVPESKKTFVVTKNTKHTAYVHSYLQISSIKELKEA